MPQSISAHETTINNRSAAQQTTRTNWAPSPRVGRGLDLGIMARQPEQLPDPWLFDSEKLLNELGRIAELRRPDPDRGFARHTLRDQPGGPSDLRLARTPTIL